MTNFYDIFGDDPAGMCESTPDAIPAPEEVVERAPGTELPGETTGRRGRMKYPPGAIRTNQYSNRDVFE